MPEETCSLKLNISSFAVRLLKQLPKNLRREYFSDLAAGDIFLLFHCMGTRTTI